MLDTTGAYAARSRHRRPADPLVRPLFLSMCLLAVLPFAVTSLPTMTDLFGHIGRFHVMLAQDASPWLRHYYRFDWHLVGNLGGDLIAWVSGGMVGAQEAGVIAALAAALLGLAGIAAVSRAAHGALQPSALVAACFVFGNPFHFGFVNYCLSLGLALLAFAAWIALAGRPLAVRLLAAAPLVLATWVAHAMGWGVLALLVAGFEGERLWRDRSPGALRRAAVLALAFAPPVALTLLWRSEGKAALFHYGTDLPERKLMAWVTILRGGSPALDIGTPVLLAVATAWLLWRRALLIDWRVASGGMLVALACTLMPATVMGSWAADERLAPAAAMALALALRGGGQEGRALALFAAALFAIRTAEMTVRWHREGQRYEAALRALDRVPAGARVYAAVLVDGCHSGWTANGWTHLPNLAIARRDALVNAQWPLTGAPLLRVVYPLPTEIRYDPSQHVPAFGCGAPDLSALHARIAALPRDRLDYLWILDTRATIGLWPGHQPVFANADTVLYRLR